LTFSLRRIVDIGFRSWTTAFIMLIIVGVVASVAARAYPGGQAYVILAFHIAMLATPTGWNIRKDVPPRQTW
jgi:cation transporter-like permease